MGSRAEQLIQDALTLPVDERARVIRELIASLDGPPDPRSDEEWASEIRDRSARLASGESKGEEWSVVRERVLSTLRRK